MTEFLGAVAIGLAAGVLSGLFGVGGGIVMTPALQVILGLPPITALATPLPVIFPTALTGAATYRSAGEVDVRAAAWMALPGIAGAVVGAALTDIIDAHVLLIVTAGLLAVQSIDILRGRRRRPASETAARGTAIRYAGIGLAAGLVSGLLGIGGGLIIVPLLAGWMHMPLKRALGTSLLAIVVLVVPGTVVHGALGHIDWPVALALTIGAVPGARIGARIALGTRESTLRLVVGLFLLTVALWYGAREVAEVLRAP